MVVVPQHRDRSSNAGCISTEPPNQQRITRNRILRGMKEGKKGKVVKPVKEDVNHGEKSIQRSHSPPSEPAVRSRMRPQKSVSKKMKVKDKFHNGNAHNAAAAPATVVAGSETALKKKAMLIADFLDQIYPYPPVPLNHYDTFTLLVAVILSAQTTDGKVNTVTEDLFRQAPDAERLAKLPYENVLEIIRMVGLAPTKARNIIASAKRIADMGKVPSTREGLEELPGVGPKTASVIISQAYKEPAFPVDTHIHRLSLRWGLSKDKNNTLRVEANLKNAFPIDRWNMLHLQMIYFGREWCPAQNHNASLCPVCSWASKPLHETKIRTVANEIISQEFSSPHKRRKGIIWYSDRLKEVQEAPTDMQRLLLPARYFDDRNE